MKYDGYAELPARRVLLACQRFKIRRAAAIAAERSGEVDRLMSRRWFKPATREAAVQILEAEPWSDYNLASGRGLQSASVVDELEALASFAETVFLSSRATHILCSDLIATSYMYLMEQKERAAQDEAMRQAQPASESLLGESGG